MARIYAGILGPLALLAGLAHGALHAREVDCILLWAWLSLWVFAAVGYGIGSIAERCVRESVNAAIAARVEEEKAGEPGAG